MLGVNKVFPTLFYFQCNGMSFSISLLTAEHEKGVSWGWARRVFSRFSIFIETPGRRQASKRSTTERDRERYAAG
jgi:hypothetical protein